MLAILTSERTQAIRDSGAQQRHLLSVSALYPSQSSSRSHARHPCHSLCACGLSGTGPTALIDLGSSMFSFSVLLE